MALKPGVVFWALPTEEVPKPHPWVVISEVVDGLVMTVNITDRSTCPDQTCLVEIGEHERVYKPSAIWFQMCRPREAAALEKVLLKKAGMVKCENATEAFLKRIIFGFRTCPHIKDLVKDKFGLSKLPTKKA